MYVLGSSIPNEIKQNNITVVKTLREDKKSHPKCVSVGYLSIKNKFSNIPLIENKLDAFTVAKMKLDSSFPESQILLEEHQQINIRVIIQVKKYQSST